MIGCLPIRFVQTSRLTFKTFCCWVCFIVDDSIECLLLIIWIVVYSSNIFFVYSKLILNYTSLNNNEMLLYMLVYYQMLWMDSNWSFILYKHNKLKFSYMSRDIAVLYSRCPWIILWWLWIILNTSNTINDSLYLSKTSEAKTQILSTNILLTCRTQKSCEPHLYIQFFRRRRPTIITRECSTDTSAEEIIYTGQTDAHNIILLIKNSFSTYTLFYADVQSNFIMKPNYLFPFRCSAGLDDTCVSG